MPALDFTSCHFHPLVDPLHGIKIYICLEKEHRRAGDEGKADKEIILFSEKKHEDLAAVFIREWVQNMFGVFSS